VTRQSKLPILAEKAGLDFAPLAGSLEQAKAFLTTEESVISQLMQKMELNQFVFKIAV